MDRPFTMADLQFAMFLVWNGTGLAPPPLRIVESLAMVDRVEDWSKARSPSRTRRRMRYNTSRIVTLAPRTDVITLPDGRMVMHPVTAAKLRNELKRRDEAKPGLSGKTGRLILDDPWGPK